MRFKVFILRMIFLSTFATFEVLAGNSFKCMRGSTHQGRVYAVSFGSYKSGEEAVKDYNKINMLALASLGGKNHSLTDFKLVVIDNTLRSEFHLVDSSCYTNRAPLGEASSIAYIFKNKSGLNTSFFEVHDKSEFLLYSACE